MRIKLLFVCSYNACRSPTAEALYRHLKGYEAKSAGINERSPRRVSRSLLVWADMVFVMEDLHEKAILEIIPEVKHKIRILGIPDRYSYCSRELIRLLTKKMQYNGIVIPPLAMPGVLLNLTRWNILLGRQGSVRASARVATALILLPVRTPKQSFFSFSVMFSRVRNWHLRRYGCSQ